MPKRWQSLSNDELRELHLALVLRISELKSMDTHKMGPNAKAKMNRQLDLCIELDNSAQKARGK